MKSRLFLIGLILAACTSENFELVNPPVEASSTLLTFEQIQSNLLNSTSDTVMVVAHRGAWANAPENSLSSIADAIELGVDMVEIDIRRTSDEVLILMHDETVDRMTDGTGRVDELSLAEIKSLKLRNRNGGTLTSEKVPTLAEACEVSAGRIMLRIDKAYDYLDEVADVARQENTLDHILFIVPQRVQPGNVVFNYESLLDEAYFFPTVDADGSAGPVQVAGYQSYTNVVALETSFADDQAITLDFEAIKAAGSRVMVYTGSAGSSGGHDDDLALTNIDLAYGWLIARGVNMIQTDQPELLLQYLRLRNLHK